MQPCHSWQDLEWNFPTDTCGLGKGSRCLELGTTSVLRVLNTLPTARPQVSVKVCTPAVTFLCGPCRKKVRKHYDSVLCFKKNPRHLLFLWRSLSLFISVVLKPDWGEKINHLWSFQNRVGSGNSHWGLGGRQPWELYFVFVFLKIRQ